MPRIFFYFVTLTMLAPTLAMANGAPVSVRDLANLHDIGGGAHGAISVSPDNRWVAFQLQKPKIADGAYELSWMVVSTEPGGKPLVVADGGELMLNPALTPQAAGNRIPSRAKWSPNSDEFVYILKEKGKSQQLWSSRQNEVGRTRLTNNAADVINFVWARDGSKLYFETGLNRSQILASLQEEAARGLLFDARFEVLRSLKPLQRSCGEEGSRTYSVGIFRGCKPVLWIYDFKTSSERLATTAENGEYNALRKSAAKIELLNNRSAYKVRQWLSSDRYAWLENDNAEQYPGYLAPLTLYAHFDGKIRRCATDLCRNYNVSDQDFWWNEGGREIIFLRRIGASQGKMGLYGWTPSTDQFRIILETDDWLSACEAAGDRLICLHETSTKPRRIASVSLENGSINALFDPNPAFADRHFSRIEKLEWKDDFGNATHGHLVYPIDYDAGRTYPLVIVTYRSRGFLRGGVGDEYPIYPLASEGFFVLSHEMPIDLEVASREKDPRPFFYKDLYLRRGVLSSQKRIIERLVSRGVVDKDRVAITGLSEGASQVTFALIHSELFSAAIASAATAIPISHYLRSPQKRASLRTRFNGAPSDAESLWHELSLGLNTDSVNAPLLLNAPDEESLTTADNVARLQEAEKPVEMYIFPDAYHQKWRPDQRFAIYRRNIQWLKFWFLGKTESEPVDLGQYKRWMSLCRMHIANLQSSREQSLRKKAKVQRCNEVLTVDKSALNDFSKN